MERSEPIGTKGRNWLVLSISRFSASASFTHPCCGARPSPAPVITTLHVVKGYHKLLVACDFMGEVYCDSRTGSG